MPSKFGETSQNLFGRNCSNNSFDKANVANNKVSNTSSELNDEHEIQKVKIARKVAKS